MSARASKLIQMILMICGLAFVKPAFAEEKKYSPEMEFSLFSPCRGNASFCAPRVLAKGEIDIASPENLKQLLAANPFINTIVFDSPGGSVIAAIEIGEIIRNLGLNTEVDENYEEEVLSKDGYHTEFATIVDDVICYSACAYAFMGGVSRNMVKDGLIGVHQFYSEGSFASEADAQVTNAILSQYLMKMGVDRNILDVASITDAAGMTLISLEIAEDSNLTNQTPALSPWQLTANDNGELAIRVNQQKPGTDRYTNILIFNADPYPSLLASIRHGPFLYHKTEDMLNWVNMTIGEPKFCIQISVDCVRMVVMTPWSYDIDTKMIEGLFFFEKVDFAVLVATDQNLHFDGGFPAMLWDQNPDVILSNEQLRNYLLALLKQ